MDIEQVLRELAALQIGDLSDGEAKVRLHELQQKAASLLTADSQIAGSSRCLETSVRCRPEHRHNGIARYEVSDGAPDSSGVRCKGELLPSLHSNTLFRANSPTNGGAAIGEDYCTQKTGRDKLKSSPSWDTTGGSANLIASSQNGCFRRDQSPDGRTLSGQSAPSRRLRRKLHLAFLFAEPLSIEDDLAPWAGPVRGPHSRLSQQRWTSDAKNCFDSKLQTEISPEHVTVENCTDGGATVLEVQIDSLENAQETGFATGKVSRFLRGQDVVHHKIDNQAVCGERPTTTREGESFLLKGASGSGLGTGWRSQQLSEYNPSSIGTLAIQQELHLLKHSLVDSGKAICFKVAVASTDSIRSCLDQGVAALHISGHGFFDPYTDTDNLLLETSKGCGEGHVVDMDLLGGMLRSGRHSPPRRLSKKRQDSSPRQSTGHSHATRRSPLELVFLASCHSRQVGETFIRDGGARYVVCVHRSEKVLDTATVVFSKVFYHVLLNGRSVREAFGVAQARVAAEPGIPRNESRKFLLLESIYTHERNCALREYRESLIRKQGQACLSRLRQENASEAQPTTGESRPGEDERDPEMPKRPVSGSLDVVQIPQTYTFKNNETLIESVLHDCASSPPECSCVRDNIHELFSDTPDGHFIDQTPQPRFARLVPSKAEVLVGRGREVYRVSKLLRAHRLVTVRGPPGIGKTTVATEVAHFALSRFRFADGVLFVSLRGVTTLVTAILSAVRKEQEVTEASEGEEDEERQEEEEEDTMEEDSEIFGDDESGDLSVGDSVVLEGNACAHHSKGPFSDDASMERSSWPVDASVSTETPKHVGAVKEWGDERPTPGRTHSRKRDDGVEPSEGNSMKGMVGNVSDTETEFGSQRPLSLQSFSEGFLGSNREANSTYGDGIPTDSSLRTRLGSGPRLTDDGASFSSVTTSHSCTSRGQGGHTRSERGFHLGGKSAVHSGTGCQRWEKVRRREKPRSTTVSDAEKAVLLAELIAKLQAFELLLILDNLEDALCRVPSDVHNTLNALLAGVPKIHLLVTSRQSLGASLGGCAEKVLTLDRLEPLEAAKLFELRAPRKLLLHEFVSARVLNQGIEQSRGSVVTPSTLSRKTSAGVYDDRLASGGVSVSGVCPSSTGVEGLQSDPNYISTLKAPHGSTDEGLPEDPRSGVDEKTDMFGQERECMDSESQGNILGGRSISEELALDQLARHDVLQFLGGHPQAIVLAAPLLLDRSMQELTRLLRRQGVKGLQVPGLHDNERGVINTLTTSLGLSVSQVGQRNRVAVLGFALFGLLPGGILKVDLYGIWKGMERGFPGHTSASDEDNGGSGSRPLMGRDQDTLGESKNIQSSKRVRGACVGCGRPVSSGPRTPGSQTYENEVCNCKWIGWKEVLATLERASLLDRRQVVLGPGGGSLKGFNSYLRALRPEEASSTLMQEDIGDWSDGETSGDDFPNLVPPSSRASTGQCPLGMDDDVVRHGSHISIPLYTTFPFVSSFARQLLRHGPSLFPSDYDDWTTDVSVHHLWKTYSRRLAGRCARHFARVSEWCFLHIGTFTELSAAAFQLVELHEPNMWAILNFHMRCVTREKNDSRSRAASKEPNERCSASQDAPTKNQEAADCDVSDGLQQAEQVSTSCNESQPGAIDESSHSPSNSKEADSSPQATKEHVRESTQESLSDHPVKRNAPLSSACNIAEQSDSCKGKEELESTSGKTAMCPKGESKVPLMEYGHEDRGPRHTRRRTQGSNSSATSRPKSRQVGVKAAAWLSKLSVNFSQILFLINRPKCAVRAAGMGLIVAKNSGDKLGEANLRKALGIIFMSSYKDDEKARQQLGQALLLFRSLNHNLGQAAVQNALGCLQQRQGLIQQAEWSFRHSYDLYARLGHRIGQLISQQHILLLQRKLPYMGSRLSQLISEQREKARREREAEGMVSALDNVADAVEKSSPSARWGTSDRKPRLGKKFANAQTLQNNRRRSLHTRRKELIARADAFRKPAQMRYSSFAPKWIGHDVSLHLEVAVTASELDSKPVSKKRCGRNLDADGWGSDMSKSLRSTGRVRPPLHRLERSRTLREGAAPAKANRLSSSRPPKADVDRKHVIEEYPKDVTSGAGDGLNPWQILARRKEYDQQLRSKRSKKRNTKLSPTSKVLNNQSTPERLRPVPVCSPGSNVDKSPGNVSMMAQTSDETLRAHVGASADYDEIQETHSNRTVVARTNLPSSGCKSTSSKFGGKASEASETESSQRKVSNQIEGPPLISRNYAAKMPERKIADAGGAEPLDTNQNSRRELSDHFNQPSSPSQHAPEFPFANTPACVVDFTPPSIVTLKVAFEDNEPFPLEIHVRQTVSQLKKQIGRIIGVSAGELDLYYIDQMSLKVQGAEKLRFGKTSLTRFNMEDGELLQVDRKVRL